MTKRYDVPFKDAFLSEFCHFRLYKSGEVQWLTERFPRYSFEGDSDEGYAMNVRRFPNAFELFKALAQKDDFDAECTFYKSLVLEHLAESDLLIANPNFKFDDKDKDATDPPSDA